MPVALVNLPDKEQEIDLTSQDPTGNLACAQNRQVAYATSTLRQGLAAELLRPEVEPQTETTAYMVWGGSFSMAGLFGLVAYWMLKRRS